MYLYIFKHFYLFTSGCAGSLFCTGFALVVASRGYSLVAKLGLLVVEASFAAEHGLWQLWLPGSSTQAQ